MKMKGCLITLGLFLLAANLFGADAISNFVKTNLDFDLKTVPFGIELKDHPEFVFGKKDGTQPQAVDRDNIFWARNSLSAIYSQKFEGAYIAFGFKAGRLAAISIRRTGFKNQHEELVKIHNAFRQLPGPKKSSRDDGLYQIKYVSFCNDSEDIFADIFITPSNPL